jgi:hypothetical protein
LATDAIGYRVKIDAAPVLETATVKELLASRAQRCRINVGEHGASAVRRSPFGSRNAVRMAAPVQGQLDGAMWEENHELPPDPGVALELPIDSGTTSAQQGRVAVPTSRFRDDPILAAAIEASEQRQSVSEGVLRSRLCGEDGAITEKLATHDLEHMGCNKDGMMTLLNILAGNSLRHNHTLISTSNLLTDLSRTRDGLVFAPGMTEVMPTDAQGMYDLLLGQFAPPLYKYPRCVACGELRRCELKDSNECRCGQPWTSHCIRVFSPLDFLAKVFAAPPLAEAMGYAATRKRAREESVADTAQGPMMDIFDTEFYRRSVMDDPLLSSDPRFALVGFFLDGMLKCKTDMSSGTVKVGVMKLFNLPAHIRQMPGCTLPIVVIPPDPPVKNVQPILDVFADQLAFLRKVGVPIYDAHRKENFRLHGDLVKLAMDSKGIADAAGRAEPGSKVGASLAGDYRGYTFPDKIKETTRDGRMARITGKVAYLENWTSLPPTGYNARVKRLRTAAASLNPREVLTAGVELPWSVDEREPRRWSDAEIRDAFACLAESQRASSREDTKHLKGSAAGVGVKHVSPWVKTGLKMDSGVTYDSMHALANVSKKMRSVQIGRGIFSSGQRNEHFVYEAEVNRRFVDVGTAVREGEELTASRMMELARYPFTPTELKLAGERGLMALRYKLPHAAIKGAKALKAYRPWGQDDNKGPQFLKSIDSHLLCSPMGKWLIAGLSQREFQVEEVKHTYEYVYLAMLSALNEVRRKAVTEDGARAAFQQVAEALTLFYIAFPAFEQDHIMHQALEVARNAPAWLHACFDGERTMRLVRQKDHNPNDLAATVMLNLQRFCGKFLREMTTIGNLGEELNTLSSRLTNGLNIERNLGDGGVQITVPNLAKYLRGKHLNRAECTRNGIRRVLICPIIMHCRQRRHGGIDKQHQNDEVCRQAPHSLSHAILPYIHRMGRYHGNEVARAKGRIRRGRRRRPRGRSWR